jgi:hypothetical protein
MAISSAASASSARREVETCQPTMRRLQASVTKAVYANPDRVGT